jgi:archaellum biogenesis ATPase FlaH
MPSGFRTIEELRALPRKKIDYQIGPGILPEGGIMVVVGDPGIGKTHMMQQLGFEIASGRRALGLFPTKRAKVCYFELEMRSDISKAGFQNDKWANEYPDALKSFIHYDERTLDITSEQGKHIVVNGAIHYAKSKVLIMDSFGVTIDDELALDAMKRGINAYRDIAAEHHVSFIIVHHLNKRQQAHDGRGNFFQAPITIDSMRGSKYLQYEAETILALTRNNSNIKLTFLKHRFSKIQFMELPELEFTWQGDSAIPLNSEYRKIMEILDLSGGSLELSTLEFMLARSACKHRRRDDLILALRTLQSYGLLQYLEGGGRGNPSIIKLCSSDEE